MLDALEAALAALAGEAGVRAVVLRGAGRAFCAGHDLREMTDGAAGRGRRAGAVRGAVREVRRVMLAITRLPQPVVAEVHGIATAAGCQLVATCDLAVAAEGTRFGVNGVNIGLFCSTPMVALTRVIGAQARVRAADDRRVRRRGGGAGARARQPGGAAGGSSPARRRRWPGPIAGKLGPAVGSASGRSTSRRSCRWPRPTRYAGQVMVANMMRGDTAEGIGAFLDKRAPEWRQ